MSEKTFEENKAMRKKYEDNLNEYLDLKHCPPSSYNIFCDGYALAQKELSQKLAEREGELAEVERILKNIVNDLERTRYSMFLEDAKTFLAKMEKK